MYSRKPSWRPVILVVYPGSVVGPAVLLIPDLDNKTEWLLSNFAKNTKLRGVTGAPSGFTAIQKDWDRLSWQEFHEIQQRKMQSPAPWSNLIYQQQLESSFADKRHILVAAKLTVRRQLWERRPVASSWAALGRAWTADQGRWPHLVSLPLEHWLCPALVWAQGRAMQLKGLKHLTHVEGLGLFSLQKRRLGRLLPCAEWVPGGGRSKGDGGRLFSLVFSEAINTRQ